MSSLTSSKGTLLKSDREGCRVGGGGENKDGDGAKQLNCQGVALTLPPNFVANLLSTFSVCANWLACLYLQKERAGRGSENKQHFKY